MPSVNEKLLDADTSHQVDLLQYANGVVQKMLALLNRVDSDLFAQLVAALERLPPESFTVDRLEQLLGSVRRLNARAYAQVSNELLTEMRDLVEYEAGYQYELFNKTLPAQVVANVDIAAISVDQAYSAAMARPFQGRLLKEWGQSLEAEKMVRIRDAIRIGYVENQTVSEIVKRIRGTRAEKYADGLIEIDRRNAEAVVRTAISHTAGVTRNRFFEANKSVIKAIVWTATLDSRTSEGCRIRDGLQYTPTQHLPIGHKIPWNGGPGQLHWNCRSVGLPVTKSWKELGAKVDIPEFSPADRASMDGVVAADMKYSDWIVKQSAARQDDILGPTRGKLLRDGKLTLDRFYNDKGKFLNLDDLRARDAAAFKKAGL